MDATATVNNDLNNLVVKSVEDFNCTMRFRRYPCKAFYDIVKANDLMLYQEKIKSND